MNPDLPMRSQGHAPAPRALPPAVQIRQLSAAERQPQHQLVSRLHWVYSICVVALIGYLWNGSNASVEDWLGFAMVAAPTLAASWMWCRDPGIFGFPLWPALALPGFAAYAIPLISDQPNVLVYDISLRLEVAFLLGLHFLAGTLAWYALARRALPKARTVAVLRYVDDPRVALIAILPAVLFEINFIYWIVDLGQAFSVVRAVATGLFLIGVYLFSSQRGSRPVSWMVRCAFWLAFWLYGATTLLSLYLLPLIMSMVVMLAALIIGQHRLPWKLMTLCAVLVGFLQEGKGDMRAEAALYGMTYPQTVDEFRDFYARWGELAWLRISTGSAFYPNAEQYSGALDRVNLLHLTLKTVSEAPDTVPYLYGETYTRIPDVLIPRFLSPDKPWSLVATHMLNIHYNIQTEDQVLDTTIGWGLVNEANANFGPIGILLIGALLGAFCGFVGHATRGMPATSMRRLFAFAMLPLATNTEMTSTVLAATLFQQLVIFTAIFLLLTRRQTVLKAA